VALILAGLAAWAVWNYLQNVESEIIEGQEIVEVFRAGEAIAEGTDGAILLSDFNSGGTQIARSEDQAEDVPVGAITSEQQLNDVLSGRVAAGPIAAGSILTESQWTSITAEVIPLADEIPSGKQAMTISTDNIRGINGFVEPGDRVNMIITLDIPENLLPDELSGIAEQPAPPVEGEAPAEETPAAVTYTRFVLQGLPVMATGRDIRPDEDAPPTVEAETETTGGTTPEGEPTEEDLGNDTTFTLEVTPEQAERIAYASENGSIWLTLVPADFVEVETTGVTTLNLFGGNLLDDIFGS
jgi:pilus assembly protein CpaB